MIKYKSRNKNVNLFLDYVNSELSENGIKIRFKPTVYSDGLDVCGFFDSIDKKLLIKRDSGWLDTLVHEFCHVLQWKRGVKAWKNAEIIKADRIVDEWILKERQLYTSKIEKAYHLVRNCEYDCDRRAVEMIREYKLPIDTDKYIRRGNRYLIFYHLVERTQNWNPENGFYCSANLTKYPAVLKKSYVNNIPDELLEQNLKYFI